MDMGSMMAEDLQRAEVLAMSPGGSSAMSSAVAAGTGSEDEGDLRRGPWTVEEDLLLVDYIAKHGEGRWNSLARSAGLRRTGKSCRLRWLNYLRPDVRRGNITPEEQLLILHLHSRWGNRWSKIAQHLPGRTDNEIKNYWRTRVQKHAKQLRCDVNSAQFRHVVRCVWMPRLVERIQAESAGSAAAGGGAGDGLSAAAAAAATTTAISAPAAYRHHQQSVVLAQQQQHLSLKEAAACSNDGHHDSDASQTAAVACLSPDDTSSALRSSLTTDASHYYCNSGATPTNDDMVPRQQPQDAFGGSWSELLATAGRDGDDDSMIGLPDLEFGDFEDNLWSLEDLCLPQSC